MRKINYDFIQIVNKKNFARIMPLISNSGATLIYKKSMNQETETK